jgi:hypothetical protein
LILKLVGTRQASNDLITDWAREQILKTLRTGVVRKLTAEKWPVLGIAGRTVEIEAALLADVQAALTPYGLKSRGSATSRSASSPTTSRPQGPAQGCGLFAAGRAAFANTGRRCAQGHRRGRRGGGGGGNAAALGVGMGLGGMVGGMGGAPPPPGGNLGAQGGPGPAPGPAGGAGPAAATASVACANCHAPNSPNAKFCSSCGTAMPPPAPAAAAHCTQCGAAIAPGAKFCGGCGTALT